MNERPEQPPEGRLLAAATEHSGLSIREASRRAGLSYGRWRQITSGVQHVSPGNFAAVHAPARTLAKMARAVGVTADQMETEGQRPDAAEIMRQENQAAATAGAAGHVRAGRRVPQATPAMRAAMAPYLAQVEARVEVASQAHPGGHLAGEQVFPGSALHAKRWDMLLAAGWEQADLPEMLAAMMAMDAEEAEAGQGGTAAGLAPLN